MKRYIAAILCTLASAVTYAGTDSFPSVIEKAQEGFFPLSSEKASTIYIDEDDFKVVEIAAGMLAEDIGRITGNKAKTAVIQSHKMIAPGAAVIAGTLGHSRLIDWIIKNGSIDASCLEGRWESFLLVSTTHPRHSTPLLAIIGSDRRGTAYGLASLCEAIGVSPWYWWADVTPKSKEDLGVQCGGHKAGRKGNFLCYGTCLGY